MASFLNNNLKSFTTLQIVIAAICIFIPLIFRSCDKDNYFPVIVHSAGLKKITSCESAVKVDTSIAKHHGNDTALTLSICKADTLVSSIIKITKRGYGFRSSLSEYAYSSKSYIFGLFYCMAAMLFLFNGAVYLNNTQLRKAPLAGARTLVIDKAGSWYNIVIGLSLLGVVFFPQYDHCLLHYIFTGVFFAGNFIVLAGFPNEGESPFGKTFRIILAVVIVGILALLLYFCKISVLVAEWFSLAAIGLHLIRVAISVLENDRKYPDAG